MSSREKGQADFDLERFIDMFDEALTSKDERVVNALRSLMMMVVLTKPEDRHEGHDMNRGPLRQLFEDLHNVSRRLNSVEESVRNLDYHHQKEHQYRTYSTQDVWPHMDKYASDVDAYKKMLRGINMPSKFTKP